MPNQTLGIISINKFHFKVKVKNATVLGGQPSNLGHCHCSLFG